MRTERAVKNIVSKAISFHVLFLLSKDLQITIRTKQGNQTKEVHVGSMHVVQNSDSDNFVSSEWAGTKEVMASLTSLRYN